MSDDNSPYGRKVIDKFKQVAETRGTEMAKKWGAPLDGHVVDSLRILAQIRTLVSAPISARLEKNTLAAQISPATQVLINLDKPAQNWYTALQVIWERSRIEGKKPQIIDLRFKSPVLTY